MVGLYLQKKKNGDVYLRFVVINTFSIHHEV